MMKHEPAAGGGRGYLDGQMLIAMPTLQDGPFARTVVFVCAHSADGAMGITINKRAREITFRDLLVQLDVIPEGPEIRLPGPIGRMPVNRGGPVETGRGFVLHSSDYFIENATLPIDEHISLTATLEILKAMAAGNGPRRAMLALGYAGWSPGQLDQRDPGERLALLPGDAGADLRPRPRHEIRSRAVADRHRPRTAVRRSGPRLRVGRPKLPSGHTPRPAHRPA